METSNIGRCKTSVIIISGLTLLLPILVMPWGIMNIFQSPKLLLFTFGVLLLAGIHLFRQIAGFTTPCSYVSTIKFAYMLILMNMLSLLYTKNLYYTKIALFLNVCATCWKLWALLLLLVFLFLFLPGVSLWNFHFQEVMAFQTIA